MLFGHGQTETWDFTIYKFPHKLESAQFQGGRGHWAIDYIDTQSFIATIYSLFVGLETLDTFIES